MSEFMFGVGRGEMTTITIINPWTGAQGTRDVSDATQQQIEHYAAHMDDDENYLCECSAGTPAEWVAHMAAVLGAKRAGEIILS